MEANAIHTYLNYIAAFNLALTAAVLIGAGRILASGTLTAEEPGPRQNAAEWILDFFVNKAREMGDSKVVAAVAPFLATCFLLIFVSNLLGVLPILVINNPPAAFFSVPLGLALSAVLGTLVLSGAFNGIAKALKHLVWPNPLQLVSEVTDVLSLALRLFGNIGGEHMTVVLVSSAVVVGIPLILHILGLIPAFVQALVFTLLTASFVAGAIHHEEKRAVARERTAVPDAPKEV